MSFKRKMDKGQKFQINNLEFVCMEVHAYLQTRVDGENSDIDVGSSYYIVRNVSTGSLHRIPFQKIIDKENEIKWMN